MRILAEEDRLIDFHQNQTLNLSLISITPAQIAILQNEEGNLLFSPPHL